MEGEATSPAVGAGEPGLAADHVWCRGEGRRGVVWQQLGNQHQLTGPRPPLGTGGQQEEPGQEEDGPHDCGGSCCVGLGVERWRDV